jgi:hypothetical protein
MEKSTVTSVNYEKSDTIEKQGKRRDIEKIFRKWLLNQRAAEWLLGFS